LHNASTDKGSSGSPIIRRSKDNNIIGLHKGGIKNKYNLAIFFISIFDNIKVIVFIYLNFMQLKLIYYMILI